MKRVARWARAEWGPLYVTVRAHVLRRRWRAVPLAMTAVCLTLTLHVVHNQPWGYDVVQDVGAVRAADPLWLALLRTPLSLFVPALDLPVWGALVQILFVFGIAEICLGRWRTLALAYAATLAGTLYARVGVSLGPHHPFGLTATDAHVVDTGPSAAVVGLAVFLGWRYGARVTAGAVIVAMVIEVVAKENLAGREHLAAIAAMLLLCALSAVRRRRGGRVGGGGARNAGAGSGAGSRVSDDGSGVPRTDSEGGAGSSAGGGGEPRGRIGTRAGAGAQRGTGTGVGAEAGAGGEAEVGLRAGAGAGGDGRGPRTERHARRRQVS
ncbi:Integral membrane protein OS=Streptomyces griseorubiginosus OX=67304 GN=DWG14_06154 PE=4 SV=1 [Streptomyces griseorubiginosus]